jgi:hypothetical protein
MVGEYVEIRWVLETNWRVGGEEWRRVRTDVCAGERGLGKALALGEPLSVSAPPLLRLLLRVGSGQHLTSMKMLGQGFYD